MTAQGIFPELLDEQAVSRLKLPRKSTRVVARRAKTTTNYVSDGDSPLVFNQEF